MSKMVIVPTASLSKEALQGVVEDFVTREGTDYGLVEHSLEQKTRGVLAQLSRGEVLIVFDAESETVTLIKREDWIKLQKEDSP